MHVFSRIKNKNYYRFIIILLQGFYSGLPLALIGSTLQTWFAVSNINVATIGVLALVGQPYVYKFLWAPLFDRYMPPFLGRRRGWILITQFFLVLSFTAITFFNPINSPWVLALISILIAFFSASQDIVIDAYRTEILEPNEFGLGSANYTLGYRTAMLISSSGALILAAYIGWQMMYFVMSLLMVTGILITFISPEEQGEKNPVSLQQAIIEPLKDFYKRDRVWLILVFIIVYKLTDAFALSLGSKFLIDMGFSLTAIGVIYKGVGIGASLLGAFVGGIVMLRLSLFRALFLFGILQAASNLLFAWLALVGKNLLWLTIAVSGESFCSSLATVALMAFLMSLCNKKYTATQYALFSSIAAIGRVYIGPIAGIIALHYDVSVHPANWAIFYLWSFVIAVPAIVLLYWIRGQDLTNF